jgi:transcriptional regulator GlxA family with amidase domain
MARRVVFVVFPGFQLLGLSGPTCAFQLAKEGDRSAYEIEIVSSGGGEVTCSAGFRVATKSHPSGTVDTLIVVGGNAIWEDKVAADVARLLSELTKDARRIASICTGAFALAEIGLLQNKQATTHWRRISKFRSLYPEVDVVTDRLFTRDGKIWTSAGISAGIDLALALIEDDLGAAKMRDLSQELVVKHREIGGQPQFLSSLEIEASSDRIRRAITYAQTHLAKPLSVNVLAEVACISERQFSRAFRRETGLSVAKAIEMLRADAARSMVEATFQPLEAISRVCGFGDPERMRRTFVKLYGRPPRALRQGGGIERREMEDATI